MNKTTTTIWYDKTKETNKEKTNSYPSEISRDDIKEIFLTAICERVIHSLDINYKDRRIAESLLKTALNDEVSSRDGLLDQFLNHELEIISNDINIELGIQETICPEYATHARLNNHIEAIKKKMEIASSILYTPPIEVKEDEK